MGLLVNRKYGYRNSSLIAVDVSPVAKKAFSACSSQAAPLRSSVARLASVLLFAGVYGAWDLTLWIIKNRDKTERRDDPPNRGESAP
jgi:hypothetical protein